MTVDPWKQGQRTVSLTGREVSTLIRLLGVLQTNLECTIESSVLTDGSFDKDATAELKAEIAKDRLNWRLAEELVKKLDASRRLQRKRRTSHAGGNG